MVKITVHLASGDFAHLEASSEKAGWIKAKNVMADGVKVEGKGNTIFYPASQILKVVVEKGGQ